MLAPIDGVLHRDISKDMLLLVSNGMAHPVEAMFGQEWRFPDKFQTVCITLLRRNSMPQYPFLRPFS
jgi:hypothetical protein